MGKGTHRRTESETLFEHYLSSNGYEDWEYEPDIPGRRKHPDYLLRSRGREFLFEVKELHQKAPPPKQPRFIDPYKSLRDEINEARKQFTHYKEWCCSLVVFNIDDWQARLKPRHVFAAMLGDLGIRMDFDANGGVIVRGSERPAFLERGKMLRPKTYEPQNTTIAAILVLERFRARNPAFVLALKRERSLREAKIGRPVDAWEACELHGEMLLRYPGAISEVLRVVVHENPFARKALPRDLFTGPYDERWAIGEDGLQRTFVGASLRTQEDAESSRRGAGRDDEETDECRA